MLYNFSIFSRQGHCLYYNEWIRLKSSNDLEDEKRLLFGLLYSLREFLRKLSPSSPDSLVAFHTNVYTLTHYETMSGLRFIFISDKYSTDENELRAALRTIYYNYYVPYVSKDPFHQENQTIDSSVFISNVKQYIETLTTYKMEKDTNRKLIN